MMDQLTFVVEMTKALAWPLAVAVIFSVYRKSLLQVLERLHELRFGSFGATFADKQEIVAEKVGQAVAEQALPPTSERLQSDLATAAQIAPGAAIIEAWGRLELLLRQLAKKYSVGALAPTNSLPKKLQSLGALDDKDVSAIEGLRALRNLAAHAPGSELTTEKALEFIALSTAIEYVLGQKLSKQG